MSRVSNQNGVSPLYIMLEIHHSGREPSNCAFSCFCYLSPVCVVIFLLTYVMTMCVVVFVVTYLLTVCTDVFTSNNIIALKGAVQDFLQSPHYAVDYVQHVCSGGPRTIMCKSCAAHRALITCNMLC